MSLLSVCLCVRHYRGVRCLALSSPSAAMQCHGKAAALMAVIFLDPHTQLSSGEDGKYILQACCIHELFKPSTLKAAPDASRSHAPTPAYTEGTSPTPSGGGNNFQWGVFLLPVHISV